jgi:hypothetical protein
MDANSQSSISDGGLESEVFPRIRRARPLERAERIGFWW